GSTRKRFASTSGTRRTRSDAKNSSRSGGFSPLHRRAAESFSSLHANDRALGVLHRNEGPLGGPSSNRPLCGRYLIVRSTDAETTRRPSGVTAHARTPCVWPSNEARIWPESASQILSVRSSDAETTYRPSGVTVHERTRPTWPVRVV